MNGDTLRVVLVEDHPIYRDGLRLGLTTAAGIDVVGEASDPATAREVVERECPDVVVMDLDLGPASGLDLTAQLVARHPGLAVLVLTMNDAEAAVFEALRAGARGYLLKGVDLDELAKGVRDVAAGEAVFGARMAARLLAGLGRSESSRREDEVLTEREREILELMAQGWGNPQIAERLFLSPKTVRNNVSLILGKLHATSRGDAVVRARSWGYGADGTRPQSDTDA